MKNTTALFAAVLQKMTDPRNVRIFMFLIPLLIGAAGGSLNEVGGNMGGCTGG